MANFKVDYSATHPDGTDPQADAMRDAVTASDTAEGASLSTKAGHQLMLDAALETVNMICSAHPDNQVVGFIMGAYEEGHQHQLEAGNVLVTYQLTRRS